MKLFLTLVLMISSLTKLAQGQAYMAEGYFVVDDETVQAYIRTLPNTVNVATRRALAIVELQKDIDYVLSEVNQIFASTSVYGLNIEVRVKKLDILTANIMKGNAMKPGISNGVDEDVSFQQFENWLLIQNSYNILKYDFAFLWTGYDLYKGNDKTRAGAARLGKICDPNWGTGIGEFNMTYMTVLYTAHEIGHLLGANHNGLASKYIMAESVSVGESNHWYFSNCTVQDIKEYLSSIQPNCLLTSDQASVKKSIAYSAYQGQLLDPEVVCQRNVNSSQSYMYKMWDLYNNTSLSGDNICGKLFCSIPATPNTYMVVNPSEGMVCDVKKRCKYGKCLADATATANVDTKCLYGDQKVLQFTSTNFTGSCQDYIAKYGTSNCYSATFNKLCCQTCKTYYTGRVGCEYGDKVIDCTKYTKSRICPANKIDNCCGYCVGFIARRSLADLDVKTLKLSMNNVTFTPVIPTLLRQGK